MNFHQAFAVEELQSAGHRDVNRVVQVHAEDLAFRGHHADHRVVRACHLNALAEGVGVAKELWPGPGAQNGQ